MHSVSATGKILNQFQEHGSGTAAGCSRGPSATKGNSGVVSGATGAGVLNHA